MNRKTFIRVAAGVLGFLALALTGFIVAGILLPGEWDLSASMAVNAEADAVFSQIDSLGAWDRWTPWGDVESTFEGPGRGEGAQRRWDAKGIGNGVMTVTYSGPPTTLAYHVEVEEGSITFDGTFALTPEGGSVKVEWSERADFGWNPLLGWTAMFMEDSQRQQMVESLERLKVLVEAKTPPT